MATDNAGVSSAPTQLGFWRENEPLGCLSNWHPTGFDFRGTRFATSEHWMMWQKARLMGDGDKAAQILAAPTPRRAKELGGEVKPYNGALWDAVREQLVYYGVREKFLQNRAARGELLSTGSALLAEASPYDRVWGVGMTADDPRFANPARWEGENLLGRTCMRVRADIRQLLALGCLEEVRAGGPALAPAIARMTLLQLSRVLAARGRLLLRDDREPCGTVEVPNGGRVPQEGARRDRRGRHAGHAGRQWRRAAGRGLVRARPRAGDTASAGEVVSWLPRM